MLKGIASLAIPFCIWNGGSGGKFSISATSVTSAILRN